MEIQTSTQAYEQYQKLRLREEKLEKNNRGMNLITLQSPTSFFVKVEKIVSGNLLERKERIEISSNLPFMSDVNYWNRDKINIKKFLDKLQNYVVIPIFKPYLTYNRKADNKISSWGLTKFRENKIDFEEIDFQVGEEASKDFDLSQFKASVLELLNKQKVVSQQEENDFNRYLLIMEKIDDLKRQVKESYNYGYRQDTTTIRIVISEEEYDKKLSEFEDELKKLKTTYSFLKLPTFYYKKKDDSDCEDDDEYEDDEDDDGDDDGDYY